jgi:hypothetical protein
MVPRPERNPGDRLPVNVVVPLEDKGQSSVGVDNAIMKE